jgi:hypothetical protein
MTCFQIPTSGGQKKTTARHIKKERERVQNLNLAPFRVFFFATIQLPNLNNSVLDNIALRTALTLQPLFIKFPLVANKTIKRALIFSFNLQNIRA